MRVPLRPPRARGRPGRAEGGSPTCHTKRALSLLHPPVSPSATCHHRGTACSFVWDDLEDQALMSRWRLALPLHIARLLYIRISLATRHVTLTREEDTGRWPIAKSRATHTWHIYCTEHDTNEGKLMTFFDMMTSKSRCGPATTVSVQGQAPLRGLPTASCLLSRYLTRKPDPRMV